MEVNLDLQVLQEREKIWEQQKRNTIKRFYKKGLKDTQVLNISLINLQERLEDGTLQRLYEINKSITQSYRMCAGKAFEQCIERIFNEHGISFSKQVLVDSNGIVCLKKSKNVKMHYLDFVIPEIQVGQSVYDSRYRVVSVKTSVRERYLQDVSYPNLVLISLEQVTRNGVESIKVCDKEMQLTSFISRLQQQNSYVHVEKAS